MSDMEKKPKFGIFDNFFGSKDKSVEPPAQENINLNTELENDGSFVNYSNNDGAVGGRRTLNYTPELYENTNRKNRIRQYRRMAKSNEVSKALEDIVNDCIVSEDRNKIVELNLDQTNIKESKKQIVHDEFEKVLRLMNFKNKGQDYFWEWYVDGEIYFEIAIDKNNPKNGIQKVNKIDPMKMTKVKTVTKKMDPDTGKEVITGFRKYYLYQPLYNKQKRSSNASNFSLNKKVMFSEQAILYASSGLVDYEKDIVIGYLDKAVRPFNQLKLMEDALVVYRLARAPERRVFYIDVGNMPKTKAESYLRRVMNTYKNKITYDGDTGTLKDTNNQMMMQDDFWLPRSEGKGTEVTTLQGGQNLGETEDIEFFKRNLNESLHLPASRLDPDGGNVLGRATEISRDELNFKKFTDRLKNKFSDVFIQGLRVQLILKGITTKEEWETIKEDIAFEYNKDSFFTELKQMEVLRERVSVLNEIVEYRGVYVSNEWIRKNILQQNEEEIEEEDRLIKAERDAEQFDKVLGNEQPEPEPNEFEDDGGEGGGNPFDKGPSEKTEKENKKPEDGKKNPVKKPEKPDGKKEV